MDNQRSDERIHEEVCDCLSEHPGVAASEIGVKVEDHHVTLTGVVDEGRAKRLAEDLAAQVRGVKEVRNQIRVLSFDEKEQESRQLRE